MKRTMAMLCCMPLLLAAGCETLPKQTANRMTGSFTVGVTVTSADSEIKGELTRCGTDVWSVVFTDPPALSGVQLDFTAEEVRASYKGLVFSVPQSAQAIRTELCMFMDVVDDLAQTPELDGKAGEGVIVLEGETDSGMYTLTCAEDGTPVTFALPSYGVTVTFEGFTEQNAPATEETTIPTAYPAPPEETACESST